MKINAKKFYGGATSATGGNSEFEYNQGKFFENKSVSGDAADFAFIQPAGKVCIENYTQFTLIIEQQR